MNQWCSRFVAGFLIVVLHSAGRAERAVDFERDVRPIFEQHCVACHGADEQNGGLSFTDGPSAFAECDSGARAIVPGEVDASHLLRRVSSDDEDLRMPPDGAPLTAEEIAILREWIAAGAVWPEVGDAEGDTDRAEMHWAFQPISRPEPPTVQDETWPRGPLDHFLQARRDAAGLPVAPDAEPIALLRRASYDLTGLPPTPEELEAFLQAVARSGIDKAFSELVDQLLSRDSYGQRWGRHWMDWVRYADTAGDNSDFPIPQAYLYRNYIIDAFNDDLPYDRFLIEQLAGDLLPADSRAERNRQTIATGYLAMARRFGSLVERYPWHLTIEDTIDNVGRTMMGLTISCARCHDHKFDPISTRDYYGLYGFFASTRYPFPGIELFQVQRDLVPLLPEEEVDRTLGPHQAKTDALSAELERLLSECRQRAIEIAAAEPAATVAEQRKLHEELDAMLLKARRAGEALAKHLKTVPKIPAAYAVHDDEPRDVKIQIKGEPVRPGAVVPRKFLDVLGGEVLPREIAESGSGRLQLAKWIASPENPLTARVIVNRVWQRHFGKGIVRSTSDFGTRGENPSHPALLDWLAQEFIQNDWSIKHLHRLIMNSRAYRLSSIAMTENVRKDPENNYYWKFDRRRLDAEEIRDTLLLISGSLDRTPQSEPYPIPPQDKWEYTQHHPFKDDYQSNKRSVYLMTKRLTVGPYLQTFDGPDPNVCTSDRDQSVTPLQALYFVNDEFLHAQASLCTQRILAKIHGDAERIDQLCVTILGRWPNDAEARLMRKHVDAAMAKSAGEPLAEQHAWSSLVRSLMRLNEFIYID